MSPTNGVQRTYGHHTTVTRKHVPNRHHIERLRSAWRQTRPYTLAGTIRRLEALQAMGWPEGEICDALAIADLSHADNYRHALADLTSTWGLRRGPCRDTEQWARALGFRTVLAWDHIDDPTEHPAPTRPAKWPLQDAHVDLIAVDKLTNGKLPFNQATVGERRAAITRLSRSGWAPIRIAELMGLKSETVQRYVDTDRRARRAGVVPA